MCNTEADRFCPPSICFKDEVRNYLISIANLENTDNCVLKFDMLKNGKLIKKPVIVIKSRVSQLKGSFVSFLKCLKI